MLRFGKSKLLGKTIVNVTEYMDGTFRLDFDDKTNINIALLKN